jgi:predicted dehydrogenase
MASKTIGILGLGSIGLRHARNLRAMGHMVRGYDIDMKKRLAFDGVLWDMEEVLECKAIIIASPTPMHAEHILNMPPDMPLFVEKPIGASRDDLNKIRTYMEKRTAPVYVGNNLRLHECVRIAKDLLINDAIGLPISASFYVAQLNRRPYAEDVILNWGGHELDLACYLIGSLAVTSASGDHDHCNITLQNSIYNCPVFVHLDYLSDPEQRGFFIAGSKGYVSVDLVKRTFAIGTKHVLPGVVGDDWDGNYLSEMKEFVKAIDGEPSKLLATGEDGLATLELILKIKELAGIK